MRSAGVAYKLALDGTLLKVAGAQPLVSLATSVELPRPERLLAAGTAPRGADRIAVSVPAYPGWRAWLDGSPAVLEPQGFFQAVRLPEGSAGGTFDLRLDFSPPHWLAGVLVSLLAWAAWLASWGLRFTGEIR